MINWRILDSAELIESILEDSYTSPQLIFKHSTTCPISGMAKRRLEKSWDFSIEPYCLDLLSYRSISNNIAERLAVVHQSPQVILIRDGLGIYHESHLDISAKEIQKHLDRIVHE